MTDHISRRTALGLAGAAAISPLLARTAFAQGRPYGTFPHILPSWAPTTTTSPSSRAATTTAGA
jgi:hypothetical protein